MEELLDQLKQDVHRKTTRGTYYNVWKNFNKFLIRLDRMPKCWEDRVSLYCAFLITIKGRKSATVKSYVSGIKHILITDGYDWDNGKNAPKYNHKELQNQKMIFLKLDYLSKKASWN